VSRILIEGSIPDANAFFICKNGTTENAGVENARASKNARMENAGWKLRDYTAVGKMQGLEMQERQSYIRKAQYAVI